MLRMYTCLHAKILLLSFFDNAQLVLIKKPDLYYLFLYYVISILLKNIEGIK